MALDVSRHQAADETEAGEGASRRAVLRAAGVGAATAVGLTAAACGSSSGSQGAPTGDPIAKTAQIPVDGGEVVAADGGTVITQPSAGSYKAFTAICTHAGCTVNAVANNEIQCPCHGSIYSAEDGSVIQGPAPAPLAAKSITVTNGLIYLS